MKEVLLEIVLTAVFTLLFIVSTTQAFAEEKNPPPPPFVKGGIEGLKDEKLYSYYCSPCHGVKGDGNGFNAKNLDPRPANHTNPNLMTKRTDEELFDAISGGGKRVGKSTLMPPWGNTFDKGQIKSLVQYLRKLCKCEGE
ncbi:MAG: cytochrome c [Nitrospirota bacterium]